MIKLWRIETVKLVFRKRMLIVPAAFLLVAVLNLDDLLNNQYNYKLNFNIWDGILGVFFNYVYFKFVILLIFVFLVTDNVMGDIASGWMWLTLVRCTSRYKWWAAKVASVFTAGLIYILLGIIVVFLISLLSLPYEATFSKFATDSSNLFIRIGTYIIPPDTKPFILCVNLMFYTAFAISIFTLIPVTLSLALRKAYQVLMIPIAWITISHFLNSNQKFFQIDLIPRLYYGAYYEPGPQTFSISSSLLYLLIVGVGLWCLGVYILKKTDF